MNEHRGSVVKQMMGYVVCRFGSNSTPSCRSREDMAEKQASENADFQVVTPRYVENAGFGRRIVATCAEKSETDNCGRSVRIAAWPRAFCRLAFDGLAPVLGQADADEREGFHFPVVRGVGWS